MGIDILKSILEDFVTGFRECLVDGLVDYIDYNIVYNCEQAFKDNIGIDMSPLLDTVFAFAFLLLTLKFAWKCFDTYLLGLDGDEDASPMILFFNYVKAIVICLGFGLLFNYFTNIGLEITTKLVGALKFKNYTLNDAMDVILPILTYNISLIMFVIYVILIIVLVVIFVKKAIELEFLRIGISFSTVGLLDSDGGVFKPYTKKFFQIAWTVALQVLCYKLSVMALFNNSLVWSLALMVMAITAPTFLQEFIMAGQGGKLQSALYSFSVLRSFRR